MIPKSGYRFSEKDHAQRRSQSGMTVRRKGITLWRRRVIRKIPPKRVTTMSKQMMKTVFATLALAGAALVYAGSADAAPKGAWCAHYTDATTSCGFATLQQCRAAVSGVGCICSRRPV
jgi:hypothetical protein